MNRLSRFKKAPAVKLPPRKSRFEEDKALESDEDDNDFKKPPPNRSKDDIIKERISKNAKSPDTAATAEVEEEFRVSKYFRSSSNSAKEKEKPEEVTIPKTFPERKLIPLVPKVEATGPGPTPVFCPFCMKKLNDKLNGITHIKTCAKGLPIEKIYEAVLLLEKQIEEWQKLGLDFPAVSSENKRGKKGPKQATTVKNGGGTQRKQTGEDGGADVNLELALALSISLQEETESRKEEEKRLLIENGLKNEFKAVDTKQIPLPGPSNSITSEPNSNRNVTTVAIVPIPGITTNTNKRRGQRIVHENLPIATIDKVQKKNLVVEQLTKVYNEAENDRQQVFNVRDSLPIGIAQIPKRLREFHNMMSEKWNAAKCDPDLSSATFKVKGLIEEILVTGQPEETKQKNFDSVDDQNAQIITTEEAVKLPQFVQDVANMLLNKIACDVSVYCKQEKAIQCHTFILRARCPKLLDKVIVESSGEKLEKRNTIPLTSYTHETVKVFLWYLYTGTLESNDLKILKEVHELALEYDVKICEEFRKQSDTNQYTRTKEVITANVLVQTENATVIDQSTFTAVENKDACPSPDDAGYLFEDLTSPSGLNNSLSHPFDLNNQLESSSDRSWCRSVSLSPEGLHAATDVANYIQKRQDDYFHKESNNKRQKFGNDSNNDNTIKDYMFNIDLNF